MKSDITDDQILLLKRMNQLLAKKEKELSDRYRLLVENYEKRLIKNGGDLTDYNLDIYVDFFAGRNHPRYTYSASISRSHLEKNERTFGSDDDWSEPGFPDLGEKWCYMMHVLWDHTEARGDIFKVSNIWFEIRIEEQQAVDFVEQDMFF